MAAILGLRGTGSWGTDQRPTNFRQKILYEYPNAPAVLTMLLGMLKNESVDDRKYTTFEKTLPMQTVCANGAYGAADAVITLDNVLPEADTVPTRKTKIGHILMNETTGELMLVTARNDGADQITVTRQWGGSVGLLIADHARLTVVGSAYPEGASYPRSISFDPNTSYNYTQIFRTALELTGDAIETYFRTGDISAEQKFEKAVQHAMEMEKAFLFGKRDLQNDATTGQPIYTTGGVKYWIDAAASGNIADFSATGFNRDDWNDFLRGIYTVPGGSQNKVALCGAKTLGVLNDYAESNAHINVEPKDSTYGLTIRTLYHAWGELKLIHHPLLSENTAWTNMMFVIDTRNIVYRFMKNRDTKFLKNRQNPGDDIVVHEFLSDCGLELQHVRTHGYATGINEYIP